MNGPLEPEAHDETDCGGDPPCWEGRVDDHRDAADAPVSSEEPEA